MIENVWLTTLETVQRHRSLETVSGDWTALQVDLLKFFIGAASQQIVTDLGWLPLPYVETRQYGADRILRGGQSLLVDAPLLAVSSLTDNGTALTGYTLRPYNDYPKQAIVLDVGSFRTASISVTGIWGYVPHYPRCWRASGVVLPTGGLNASAVSITLSAGAQFETGVYLKLDNELVQVTARAGDVLTLERGVLGSTAAVHTAGTSLGIFQPLADIRGAATEWAAYLYKSRDRIGEQVQMYEGGMQIVNGLSPLVRQALQPHRHHRIGTL